MDETTREDERRNGGERRGEDRRKVSIPVPVDRRSGNDRRSGGDRRVQPAESDSTSSEFARLFAPAFA